MGKKTTQRFLTLLSLSVLSSHQTNFEGYRSVQPQIRLHENNNIQEGRALPDTGESGFRETLRHPRFPLGALVGTPNHRNKTASQAVTARLHNDGRTIVATPPKNRRLFLFF
ncbi:hypothetical protein MRX96_029605 [Rhipicephalus microplus]